MATTTRTTTAQPDATHKVTGLPIQRVSTFQVGDLVTEGIAGDGYPGVVVKVQAKAVWVRRVSYVLGNVTEDSHVNYYDDTTLVIDPQSVEEALAYGADGAHKYVLRVASQPDTGASYRMQQEVGAPVFHRAWWGIPGRNYGSVRPGASFRRDPHV